MRLVCKCTGKARYINKDAFMLLLKFPVDMISEKSWIKYNIMFRNLNLDDVFHNFFNWKDIDLWFIVSCYAFDSLQLFVLPLPTLVLYFPTFQMWKRLAIYRDIPKIDCKLSTKRIWIYMEYQICFWNISRRCFGTYKDSLSSYHISDSIYNEIWIDIQTQN